MKPKLYQKYLVIFKKFLYQKVEGEFNYIQRDGKNEFSRVTKHGKRMMRVGIDPDVEPVTVGPYFALSKKEAIEKALEVNPEYHKGYSAQAISYKDVLRERKKANESK